MSAPILLGLSDSDVLTLNFIFFGILSAVVIIATIIYSVRHKRLPPVNIRSFFYVFLLLFIIFRFSWATHKKFTEEGARVQLDFFLSRTSFCCFFSAFIIVALLFTEASLGLTRKKRFVLRIIVTLANLLIYGFIFIILIIILVDSSQKNEGVVMYELSIVFVILYSLGSSIIFLFVSIVVVLRILFSQIGKNKRIYLNAGLLLLVCIVCTICFALRTVIFLYRPATNRLLPTLIFYQYGYWIPEIPVILFLILIMNEPKQRTVSRNITTSKRIYETSERWLVGDVATDVYSPPVSPLTLDIEDDSAKNRNKKQLLLVSSAVELKGQAQPRIAMFDNDPRNAGVTELQTTEIEFKTVSSARYRTLFDIEVGNDNDREIWFGVYSSTFDAKDDEADVMKLLHDSGDESIKLRIKEIDLETKETCIGFASIWLQEIEENTNIHSSFTLDLFGVDGLSNGSIILNIEKTVNIPELQHETIFFRRYAFDSKEGPNTILLEDEMAESPMAFPIAAQLVQVALIRKRDELQEFINNFESMEGILLAKQGGGVGNFKNIVDIEGEQKAYEKWYSTELKMREEDLVAYEEAVQLYSSYSNQVDGLTFKPSAYKSSKKLSFISTNLHYQEMKVSTPNSEKPAVYDHVTVGAPAAHVYKFGNGGLYNLEMKFTKVNKKREKERNPVEKGRLDRKLESLDYEISRRRDIATCQASGALCTSFSKRVKVCLEQDFPGRLEQYLHCGFLIQFEGLLSTHGPEIGMLGDFAKGVASLELFTLQLVAGGDVDITGLPYRAQLVTSDIGRPVFQLALPSELWEMVPESVQNQYIDVYPVFFTQGINEFQTIANKIGETGLQDAINKEGYPRLFEYSKRYIDFWKQRNDHDGTSFNTINVGVQKVKSLVSHPKREKVIDLLTIPSDVCRKMGAGRVTCCKSAKDRTSMSVTYEQVRILQEKHGFEGDLKEAADALRSTGIRRMNARKNIGKNKFAFNNFQRKLLPYMYKPPTNTMGGDVQT